VAGRFPLFTDENVEGPLVEALRREGWDVVRAIDVFGERTDDEVLFEWAASQGRVFVTTDDAVEAVAERWLREWRPFRMVRWKQRHQLTASTGAFAEAFEALARKESAFAYPIEYLKP
jgi:Domain of unknown function (DUF5615)